MRFYKNFFLLIALFILGQIPVAFGQVISVKATSTGRTTGHIATLFITNNGGKTLRAQPQTVYIASNGDYQSYVATIPETEISTTGITTIVINGYCADVHSGPVPGGMDMPSLDNWLPVGLAQTLTDNAYKIARSTTLEPFAANDIARVIKSSGYSAVPSVNETGIVTWPGTDIATDGIINPINYAADFAPVIVAALDRITTAAGNVLLSLPTPHSGNEGIERSAVIQQTFWMIMASITGDEYTKKQFTDKVYDRFKSKSGKPVSSLNDVDKFKLDQGIDQFWRVFNAVASQAKVLRSNLPVQVVSAADQVNAPITFPWTEIPLIGALMKPQSGKSAVAHSNKKFPWIPTVIGAAGVGTGIYLLTKSDNVDPSECAFSVSQQIQPSACGIPNGAIIITPSPPAGYQFVWSNGSTNSQLTNVPAGLYTVTITRRNTECNQSFSFTVENNNFNIGANANTTNATCGQQNGTANITVATPGQYSYMWSNGATGTSQSNLSAGNYSVTVNGGGTCQEVLNFTITELPPEFSVSATAAPAHCGLEDGSVTVTANPPGNYSYQWSNGNSGPQDLSLGVGTYTITVSLAGGACSKTVTATVNELPTNFQLTITNTPSACGQNNGSALVNASPSGTYEYLWSNGSTTLNANNLAPGDYSVTVTIIGTQCSKSISTTVTELAPTFTPSVSTTPAACGQSNGTATVTVSPPGSYDYNWSNGSTGSNVSNLLPGGYTITVTLTGTQCAKIINANVGELAAAFQLTTTSTNADCAQANGSATVNVNPPVNYTYAWSNGSTTQQASNLTSGIYNVTITLTGTQCVKDTTVNVGQAQVGFTATLSSTPAHCGLSDGSASIAVQPVGSYTYIWSNGATSTTVNDLPVGTINVTVTDSHSCSSAFNVTVDQLPLTFITIDSTSSANCLGGGEINFTISSPGSGPLVVQVVSDADSMVINLPAGSYPLSEVSSINIVPGNYHFVVYDLSIGSACSEGIDVNVGNVSTEIDAIDDFYTTGFNQALNENVITNDTGLQLTLTDISNENGGQATFNPNGQFTFTPDEDFTGEATFTYTIEDACGTTAIALVTILVLEGVCDFTISPAITPASCGLQNGRITVNVNQPGNYTYLWQNGSTGATLSNLVPGNYTVTISNVDLQCSLVFTIPVPQAPIDHISNLNIIQPSCEGPGEISFNAFTSGGNPLAMTVDHPNGSDAFLIVPGTIQLSDYVPIVPGSYTIEVFDAAAGPSCSETLIVQLQVGTSIFIVTSGIIPPTTPQAQDGQIFVTASSPGVLPYDVVVNGVFYETVNINTFVIDGVGTGNYTISLTDANGCFSNVLFVEVPPPSIIFSLGTNAIYSSSVSNTPELGTVENNTVTTWMTASFDIPYGNTWHELQFMYSPSGSSSFVIDYFKDIYRHRFNKMQLRSQIGIGIHHGEAAQLYAPSLSDVHWNVKGSAQYRLGKFVDLKGSVTIAGWNKIAAPIFDLGCRINFPFRLSKDFSFSAGK
ncbi:MAG: Ig-like domain-containing protein [Bacteroidota bacterium]|nr:Ig-like domain-containing protein [Bacteroidota bacterium]